METSALCRFPDQRGVYHVRCVHIIAKPKGEAEPRQCRRAASHGARFCEVHRPVEDDDWLVCAMWR